MTEAEAKTKWCPVLLAGAYPAVRGVKISDGEFKSGTMCQGSACMMWREIRWTGEVFVGTEGSKGIQTIVEGGYCGLAGKP